MLFNKQFYRAGRLMIGAGILCGLFSVGDLRADGEAYTGFKIEDMPWVDNRQCALFLNGATAVDARKERTSYGDYSPTLYQSGTGRDTNASVSLNPTLEWLNYTLEREWQIDAGLDLSYASEDATDKWRTWYATSSTANDVSFESRSVDLSFSPTLRYNRYYPDSYIGSTFSLGLNGYMQNDVNRSITGAASSSDDGYTARYSLNPDLEVEAGVGRMYDGAPAYEAMQIVTDLRQAGKLLKTVSSGDMKQLSALIAQLRRRILLDTREKTRASVEAVCRFLGDKGYLKADDPGALLTVDDTYRYMGGEARNFGETVAFAGQFGYYYQRTQTKIDYLNNGASSGNSAEGRLYRSICTIGPVWKYARPLNRQWQLDGDATLAYSPLTTEEYYLDGVRTVNSTGMDLQLPSVNARVTYFHNTRWTADAAYSLRSTLQYRDSYALYGSRPLQEQYRLWTITNALSLASDYSLSYDLHFFARLSGAVTMRQDLEHKFNGSYTAAPADILPADKAALIRDSYNGATDFKWQLMIGVSYQIF